jgi:cation transport ATPase
MLDEMQEQKLLRIERNGAWLAFWGLLATIVVQTVMEIGQENLFQKIAGEWVVFLCLGVYLGVSCIKNGIWDRYLQPNLKTNVVVSLIAGAVSGIISLFTTYFRYENLAGSIATGAIVCSFVFILALTALSLSAYLYKKRVAGLESETEEKP